MKNLKTLEDFGSVNEATTPIRIAFRDDIGKNLALAIKIHKSLLDVEKELIDMGNDIAAFKAKYPSLDHKSEKMLEFMKSNISKMIEVLKPNQAEDSMIDNIDKLKRNMDKLKKRNLGASA